MKEKNHAEAMLDQLFKQAKAQFGDAIKGFWFYDGEGCPGCGFPVDAVKHKGKRVLSLNAFIYRPRGVLIGYVLCGPCAKQIFQAGEQNPNAKTDLHTTIEQNLINAYRQYLASQDA